MEFNDFLSIALVMCSSSALKNCHTLYWRVKDRMWQTNWEFLIRGWINEWEKKNQKTSGEDGIKIEKIINSDHDHDSIPSQATSRVPQQTKEWMKWERNVSMKWMPSKSICGNLHAAKLPFFTKKFIIERCLQKLNLHNLKTPLSTFCTLLQCAIICVYKPHSCSFWGEIKWRIPENFI